MMALLELLKASGVEKVDNILVYDCIVGMIVLLLHVRSRSSREMEIALLPSPLSPTGICVSW